jgi:hypothetical protein
MKNRFQISGPWVAVACLIAGFLQGEAKQLQVVNYAESPVYATTVSVPAERVGASASRALKAVDQHGRPIPLQLIGDDLHAYLSLKPVERLDLDFSPTESWAESMASASFEDGRGYIANGIVRLDYASNQWKLAFDGPLSESIAPQENMELIRNCEMDLWLDTKNRGRLLDYKEKDLRELGLIHTSDARLVSGEATVIPDGSVSLKLVRTFDGFAKNVIWTQTYTLLPGLPQVIVNSDFIVNDDSTLYLAYVNQGSGLAGRYGTLLRNKPLFKFVDPENPAGLITGGASSSLIRVSWRGERCWLGFSSEKGAGLGISTLEDTKVLDRGATVWNVNRTDFRITLIENERMHFPFDISREKPFRNGLTLLGTSGDIDIWQQTKDLFNAQTKNQPLPLMQSCAVFLDGEPLQTGFINQRFPGKQALVRTPDGKGLQAAVKLSGRQEYLLGAQAEQPTTVRARMFPSGKEVEFLSLSGSAEQTTTLSSLRKNWTWSDKGSVDFVLTVPAADGLTALSLQKASKEAPELSTPRADQLVTDYAVFYRWKKVPGAIDYELQWAADVGFAHPQTRFVRMETAMAFYMPNDEELPASGLWYWRVRAIDGDTPGVWSDVRKMIVNNDHSRKPLQYSITPEHPLFTYEGCRVKRADVGNIRDVLPQEMLRHVAFVFTPLEDEKIFTQANLVEYFHPLAGSDLRFFTRPMHPGSMADCWGSLSEVEALFKNNPNCMGSEVGEAMSALYKGGEQTVFSQRLIRLCAKYGKLFYIADGTYPMDNKLEDMYRLQGDFIEDHKGWLAFAQKNNILQRQMLTQSAVLGMYLSNACVAQGAWEDGGWYWQQAGFSTLGNLHGRRGGDVKAMPRIFWCLNFVMGISRGTTIFSLDGQTGTVPDPVGLSEIDKPLAGSPSAYWTRGGQLLPTYSDFIKPLFMAIVEHQLIPTKEQLLENIKLAVYNDDIPATEEQEPYYRQFQPLYAGTYGFKPMSGYPGELFEFFPNTGRYHYFPIFPQGKVSLGSGIPTLPLSQLMDENRVRETFDAAYPEWYQGDALVGLVGDTLTVLNSNENLDEQQTYSLPLKNRAAFTNIEGTIDVHSYLVGKFENNNQRLWMQTHSEYPERAMTLKIACAAESTLEVAPAEALLSKHWKNGKLELELSCAHGVVELEVGQEKVSSDRKF